MYNCPTCGNQISMNAPICFNCGETAWGRSMPGMGGGGAGYGGDGGCAGIFWLGVAVTFLMFVSCAGIKIFTIFF